MNIFFPKNKNINYLENTETKHPLLELILKQKNKKEKTVIYNSVNQINPDSLRSKTFRNLILKNKENNLNDNNEKSSQKIELNEHSYLKDKIENIYSDIEGSKTIRKNSSKYKRKRNSIKSMHNVGKINRLIDFSSDNSYKTIYNINSITSRKNSGKNLYNNLNNIHDSHLNNLILPKFSDSNKFDPSNYGHCRTISTDRELLNKSNKTNINNFSIFKNKKNYYQKTKTFKNLFLEKAKEKKDKFQKSAQKSLLKTNTIKYHFQSKISEFRIDDENTDKEEESTIKNNINKLRNNLISNISDEKNKLQKIKSLNFKSKFNYLKNEKENNIFNNSLQDEDEEIPMKKKRKSIFCLMSKNKNMKNNFPFRTYNSGIQSTSPRDKDPINLKRKINKKTEKLTEGLQINENISDNNNSDNYEKLKIRRRASKEMTHSYNNNFKFLNLLEKKYKKINNLNRQYTIKEINKKNKKKNNNNFKDLFYSKKNVKIFDKKKFFKDIFEKEIISSRSESLNSINSGKIIIFNSKEPQHSNLDLNSIINKNFVIKDENNYINKKRLKIVNLIKEKNKSSYLYKNYEEEIKKYFIKNYVLNKITEIIYENFEPLEYNIDSNEMKKKIEKEIKETFYQILNKHHNYSYYFGKINKLLKNFAKKYLIHSEIKIRNNYILEKFKIYEELLKKYKYKWNNKRMKDFFIVNGIKLFNSNIINDENKVSNEKRKSNFIEKININFYLYIERMKRDIEPNSNELSLKSLEEKINFRLKAKGVQKTSKNNKLTYGNQKNVYQSGRSSINKIDPAKINKQSSKEVFGNDKYANFNKIKNEFGFAKNRQSFRKFAKIFRLSGTPSNNNELNDDIKNENNNDKKFINSDTNYLKKEEIFSSARRNIDNYNILTNKKIFHYTFHNTINVGNTFSKILNTKKFQIQLDKKLRLDTMKIRIAGLGQLTREAALLKTQEIEKGSPEVMLFNEIINIFQERKISKFNELLKNKEEIIYRIINNQEISSGNTLLIYATQNNLKSIVELLLLKGADPNIQNNFGNSALHIAYMIDKPYIINVLLEYGADDKLKNNKGQFPCQTVKYYN